MKPVYFHSEIGLGHPNAEPGKNIPKTKNYVKNYNGKNKKVPHKVQIWFINLIVHTPFLCKTLSLQVTFFYENFQGSHSLFMNKSDFLR